MSGGVQNVTVADADAGLRLDRWFKQHYPGLGFGRLQKLLRTGQVRVDGGRAKPGDRLEAGQTVRVPPLPDDAASASAKSAPTRRAPTSKEAEDLRARVLYKDDSVLVIDKPAGLAVQGGSGLTTNLDALMEALKLGAKEAPRLVHRLDRDTSGVLVLARTRKAATALADAFKGKATEKIYWAVVVGVPKPSEGTIDLPLSKLPGRKGDRMAADVDDGKRALTRYRVLDHAGRKAAWLEMSPITGRTHQLRVHAAAIGTPILGDGKYGGREAFLPGSELAKQVHLHARRLTIPHPDGGTLSVEAPLPRHLEDTFAALGFAAEAAAGPERRRGA